jgi:ADP-heptose:LPS heptosyltransferase
LYPARAILVLDLTPFGKSVGLIPAVRSLRSAYPNALVVAAASTGTCQLLMAARLADDTIELGLGRRPGTGRALFAILRRTRHTHFDLVLDFSPHVATQLIGRLILRSRVVTPVNGTKLLAGLLAGMGLNIEQPARLSRYESLLQQLGIELRDPRIRVLSSRDEDQRFEEKLARGGSSGAEPLVVLQSAAAGYGDEWPSVRFLELASRLANNFGVRCVAADEPGSSAFTSSLGAGLPTGSIILERADVLQLGSALARASVVVTDNSGVARFAEELGAPVVSTRLRTADQVFDEVAETLQANRSEALFKR